MLLLAIMLAFSPRLTGLPLHEWVGLLLVGLVLVHLLVSWPWIRAATRTLGRRAGLRSRFNVVMNVLLFVLFTIEITSGLAISAVALPAAGIPTVNDGAWRALHNLTLNWTLLVLGIHVAMNWHPLLVGIRRHLGGAPRAN